MTTTTGKYTQKRYKCALEDCGHERLVGTNHFGEIYSKCPECGWMGIMRQHRSTCLEPLPEGMEHPPNWKHVTVEFK